MRLKTGSDIALYSSERTLTFDDLHQEMLNFISALRELSPVERPLLALRVDNSVNAVVACMACWQESLPFILLDKSAEYSELVERYQVNVVCAAFGDGMQFTINSSLVHEINPQLRMCLSTSGTTGYSKLVMLSDDNLKANARSISEYLNITPLERGLLSLPFAYSYGFSIVSSHLLSGASVVLAEPDLMGKALWQAAKQFQASSFAGVPFSYQFLIKLGLARCLPESVKTLTQAGGKLAAEDVAAVAEFSKQRGMRFYVMYGQTEASPRIAFLPAQDAFDYSGSIGGAIPGGELWIEDEQGRVIENDNVSGELVYRGPNVMLGYATEIKDFASIANTDTLRTGDLAYREGGRYYISGRLKRMIKLNGKRYSLDDLQAQLSARLGIAELVCAGTDDKLTVVYTDPALTDRVKPELAEFGVSMSLVHTLCITSLPLTANGKFDLRSIEELLGEQ